MVAEAQEVIVYGGSGSRRGADVFRARASSIDVISPQVYAVDSLGNVRGGVPQRLLEEARETGTRLMPLIMNPGFNQEIIHALLDNVEAQQKTIDFMVEEGLRASPELRQLDAAIAARDRGTELRGA